MELQTTRFVKGGLDSLENEISIQRKKGFCPSCISRGNDDFFVVFRQEDVLLDLSTRRSFLGCGSLIDLNKDLENLAQDGWYAMSLVIDDSDYLIIIANACVAKPSITQEQEFRNYLLNYGND